MAPLAARKVMLLGLGVLAVLLLAGLPGLGQGVTDPTGELADAECYGHHKAEGFRSMDLLPTVLTEVPKGQLFEFQMIIRNPWLHELQDLKGYVNITDAPGHSFPGEKEPYTDAQTGTLQANPGGAATTSFGIPVETNATEIVVRLVGDPGSTPAGGLPGPLQQRLGNDFDLTVTSPDGATIVLTGPDPGDPGADPRARVMSTAEELRVNQTALATGGTGQWNAIVDYYGAQPDAPFAIEMAVYYNLSKSTMLIVPGPAKLGPGETHTFTFQVFAKDVDGLQAMRYGGLGVAYHEHTDKNIGDVGNYDKWGTIQFQTGASLVVGSGPDLDVQGSVNLLEPVFRRWGQVLGFAASFLVIPSLVFGGTFGKASVVKLNGLFGGPRRRVLFHNSMSFWLLGISLLHLVIFLYESFWTWSHGLVWGGLSLAAMIGLGVTGATQRRFVAKWGFNRWRFVHFAMGILVVVFVLVHMVADGSHLAAIRDMFGGTVER